jgi:hypothetical protein
MFKKYRRETEMERLRNEIITYNVKLDNSEGKLTNRWHRKVLE